MTKSSHSFVRGGMGFGLAAWVSGCSLLGHPVHVDVIEVDSGRHAYFKSFDVSRSAGIVLLTPDPQPCASPNPETDYSFRASGGPNVDVLVDRGRVIIFHNEQPTRPTNGAFSFPVDVRVVSNFEFLKIKRSTEGAGIRRIPTNAAATYTCYW